MIAVSIAGVIAALAVPNVMETVYNSRVNSAADTMSSYIRYARSQAASQGTPVLIGAQDNTNWGNGVVIWTETDNDNTYEAGVSTDTLIRAATFSTVVTVTETSATPKKFIRFNGQGYTGGTADFNICDSRHTGEAGRTINVLASGFSSMKKKAVPCG